jgi:hypothetical protein
MCRDKKKRLQHPKQLYIEYTVYAGIVRRKMKRKHICSRKTGKYRMYTSGDMSPQKEGQRRCHFFSFWGVETILLIKLFKIRIRAEMSLAHKSGFAVRVSPRRAQTENKNCHVLKS